MKIFKFALTVVTGLTVTFGMNAFAAAAETAQSKTVQPRALNDSSEAKPHVGVQFGVANPEGSYDSGADYALDVGVQPFVPFAVGLELGQSKSASQSGAEDLKRTLLLGKATYNFAGENRFFKYTYVGVGLGRSFGTGGDLWVSAPLLGFDIPLSALAAGTTTPISVGAVGKYLVYEGSNPDSMTVDGMVKYWF
jgi:hypothetical protein